MRKFIVALVLSIIVNSCSSDSDVSQLDCSVVDCASGNILLEFLDSETGENLFFNGTYSFDDLRVIDVATDQDFLFFTGVSEEFETAQIALNPFFESRDNVVLRIIVADGFETDLSFNVEFVEGECCNINNYTEVAFTNVELIEVGQNGLSYSIFL